MKLRFTKMQGAGNDFVVLDSTRHPLTLTPAQLRHLADRRFGVGCDQILVVGASAEPGVDFSYRIFNGDGSEVEQCGNGSRCFVRYVVDKGLSDKPRIRVRTVNNLLDLQLCDDGRVRVDMGAPRFEHPQLPFEAQGLQARALGNFELWRLPLRNAACEVAVLSMGNPHAVQLVDDVSTAPVLEWGPQIEANAHFPRLVNAGFMQVINRTEIKLRVFERAAGETLACGTGACAAVVAGIRLGFLDEAVEVQMRGGQLKIEWAGVSQGLHAPVLMTGPATTVFDGEISL